MTTESLMVHALKRGLLITDFNELSIGMILDYINQYDELYFHGSIEINNIQLACQNHFDTF